MYRERFQLKAEVDHYGSLYETGTRDSLVWDLQKKYLLSALSPWLARPSRYLDFACGTGRIVHLVAKEFPDAAVDAVDISAAMVEKARQSISPAEIDWQVGDIVTDDAIALGPYDAISAFRFLLNAEPEVRLDVLRALRRRISPSGLLIVSVQGNRSSLRTLARLKRNAAGEDIATLSRGMVQQLASASGFEIAAAHGCSVVPDVGHRRLPAAARFIDRRVGLRSKTVGLIDVIYLLRPV